MAVPESLEVRVGCIRTCLFFAIHFFAGLLVLIVSYPVSSENLATLA
jgi:hypothetical protein